MKKIQDLSDIKSWYQFRLVPTTKVKYIAPAKNARVFIYNIEWWARLNDYQRYFVLQWCRYVRKSGSVKKADEKAKRDYMKKGYDINLITQMYSQMTHGSYEVKEGRLFHLVTDPLGFKEYMQKFKLWLKKIFTKGSK